MTTLPADFGAWMPSPGARRQHAPTGSGPLNGLTFAVKDLIDTAGEVTGGGNPDWAASHQVAPRHAEVVRRLLAAGATAVGKTITDELAFSLEGENAHYGTPVNPAARDRLPGGSSSGSAVAVAAGLVDFALGTDTGGSVRIPASFCGLFAIRPTHDTAMLDGVLPFAPSYDTVGWFSRSPEMLRRIGDVLLEPTRTPGLERIGEIDPNRRRISTIAVARDAFAIIEPATAARLRPIADRLADAPAVDVLAGGAADWVQAYATLQGADIRTTLGSWIARTRPVFGASIAPRFASIDAITDQQIAQASTWRAQQRQRLLAWLGEDRALLVPTAPCPALRRDASAAERDQFYAVALAIGSIAGHAGLPQVTMPLADLDGLPIGLSLIGPPGSDYALLDRAVEIGTIRHTST